MGTKVKYSICSEEELKLAKKSYDTFMSIYEVDPIHNFFRVEFEDSSMKSLVISPRIKLSSVGLKKDSLEAKSMLIDLMKRNFQTNVGDMAYVLEFGED